MIKYSLSCETDHLFEAWFSSSEDFDKQAKRGLVECPVCGSQKISKALMAPRVSGTGNADNQQVQTAAPDPAMPPEMVQKLREIKQYVQANSENVGERFTEEARKIHYGDAEERGIYGTASRKDVASLAEEGVPVLPLPDLPEEKN
jgi:hypothetical protein